MIDDAKIKAMLAAIHPARDDVAHTLEKQHGADVSAAFVDLCDFLMSYRQVDSTVRQIFSIAASVGLDGPPAAVLIAVYESKIQEMCLAYCIAVAHRYRITPAATEMIQHQCVLHLQRFDNILLEIAKGAE